MQLLAEIAVEEGRVADAVSMLTESHRINRETGDRRGIAYDLDYLAAALARDGRAAAAARLLSRSDALRAEIGTRVRPTDSQINERTAVAIRAQLDEAAFAKAWEQGQALTLDEAVALARDS